MKTNKIILTGIIFSVIALFSINKINANEKSEIKTITIKVSSIQCGTCVKKVTKAVKKVDGVTNVKVSLDEKTATVTFDSDKTSRDAIENAIVTAGYDANDKTADANAYEKLDDCCKKP